MADPNADYHWVLMARQTAGAASFAKAQAKAGGGVPSAPS